MIKLKDVAVLNLATLLISTSGPIGRYVSTNPMATIMARSFIGGIVLFILIKIIQIEWKIDNNKDQKKLALSSFFLAIHWVLYFYALKASSVAVAMIAIYTFPIFTILLEPLFIHNRIKLRHLILAVVVMVGIIIISLKQIEGSHVSLGVFYGVCSAIAYALRNIISKDLVGRIDGSVLMAWQVSGVVIFTAPFVFMILEPQPWADNWSWLLLLGLMTTAFGHTLMIKSFRHFTSSEAGLLSSLQPLFGIILGILFLNEIPNTNIWIGGSLVVSAVIYEALSKR